MTDEEFPDLEFGRRFAFIMPCMGRLDHVKRSAAQLMQCAPVDGKKNLFVFVDFYCPDGSGDWIKSQFKNACVVKMADLLPLEDDRQPLFNKPGAHNTGALEAIERGAEYLVFIDADTLITPQLIAFLYGNASRDRFMIFEPSLVWRDLTGFLVVHKSHFLKVNGFDKDFKGWGAEDLEMRVKLLLRGGSPAQDPKAVLRDPARYLLMWNEIPSILAQSIPHEDDRRVANYEEKDKDQSHGLNLNLLCANIYNWIGTHPADLHNTPLGPFIRRLLGMELYTHHRSLE